MKPRLCPMEGQPLDASSLWEVLVTGIQSLGEECDAEGRIGRQAHRAAVEEAFHRLQALMETARAITILEHDTASLPRRVRR